MLGRRARTLPTVLSVGAATMAFGCASDASTKKADANAAPNGEAASIIKEVITTLEDDGRQQGALARDFPFEDGFYAAQINCVDMAMVKKPRSLPNPLNVEKSQKVANLQYWLDRHDALCSKGLSETEVRATLQRERVELARNAKISSLLRDSPSNRGREGSDD